MSTTALEPRRVRWRTRDHATPESIAAAKIAAIQAWANGWISFETLTALFKAHPKWRTA